MWEKEGVESKEKAAEHFVISAKVNPHNASAFKYLGHYYSTYSADSERERAIKCYQRALTLNPDDSESGESLCDLLDAAGKESLEVAVCREASEKSPRAFWAFRRLGYLHLHHYKSSQAVHSLQHAIRGYPTSPDLWEVSTYLITSTTSFYFIFPDVISLFFFIFPLCIGSGSCLPASWHVYCCYQGTPFPYLSLF